MVPGRKKQILGDKRDLVFMILVHPTKKLIELMKLLSEEADPSLSLLALVRRAEVVSI